MDHDLNRMVRLDDRWEGVFHHLVNAIYRRWPRPNPPPHLLKTCHIISHRGEHDNHSRFENTLPAFDAAAAAGVWGIELDVRWTRDQIPVVFHDPDTHRLFGQNNWIGQMTLDRIKKEFPLIPTLSEVIDRYGGRLHLMMEIKTEPYLNPAVQSRRIKKRLKGLSPEKDVHLMSLCPKMFTYFDFLPSRSFIPIARIRVDRFSRLAKKRRWGGVAGHYLLATNKLIARHHQLGQGIGTGFADSRRCLFREVARGVDWIFSNRAAQMQTICGRLQS